jgi:hypothetical protein
MPRTKEEKRALAIRFLNEVNTYGWMTITTTVFDKVQERAVSHVPESGEYYLLTTYGHDWTVSEYRPGKQPTLVWSSYRDEREGR